MSPAVAHVTATDEIVRQEGAKGNVTLPVVVVLSTQVPSALATKLPVVWSAP